MTLQDMYPLEFGYDEESCPICGSDMDWQTCWECGGDGYIEVYESDPMWYDEDDVERCDTCEGKGGWHMCLNYKNHPDEDKPTS